MAEVLAKITGIFMVTAIFLTNFFGVTSIRKEKDDLKKEDARLSKNERALVEKVTANFENVIVLFNISNIIEMDWLEEYDSIKAAAIIWIPGEFGMTEVARMLTGKVNPSGRLADTIAYKMEDYPSNVCFGSNKYNHIFSLPTQGGVFIVLPNCYIKRLSFQRKSKNNV